MHPGYVDTVLHANMEHALTTDCPRGSKIVAPEQRRAADWLQNVHGSDDCVLHHLLGPDPDGSPAPVGEVNVHLSVMAPDQGDNTVCNVLHRECSGKLVQSGMASGHCLKILPRLGDCMLCHELRRESAGKRLPLGKVVVRPVVLPPRLGD